MKYALWLLLFGSSFAIAASLSVSKDQAAQEKNVKISEEKKEEDCDEKAKKTVEIKEESISLIGGNTGCSLDEITTTPETVP